MDYYHLECLLPHKPRIHEIFPKAFFNTLSHSVFFAWISFYLILIKDLKTIGINGQDCIAGQGWIKTVRGKGLLNAIVIDGSSSTKGRGAWELCLMMKSAGVLAKPTHGHIVRLAPPLVISEEEIKEVVKVIGNCLRALDQVSCAAKEFH